MMAKALLVATFLFVLSATPAGAQTISSSITDGGSVVTDLGYNIKVNKGSSLHRSWVVLNDSGCPLQITGAGIRTEYGDRNYNFKPVGSAKPTVAITAFDLRFLLYDAFGEHMRTLSGTEIADVAAGSSYSLSEIGSWRAWENDVSQLLTVVAFVAQVRSSEGSIWRYNEKRLGEQLRKIQLRVTSGVLDPTKDK